MVRLRIPEGKSSITAKEFREHSKKKSKVRKHRNIPTEHEGIKFDSKLEAAFYDELVLRKKAGDIYDFKYHVLFELLPQKEGSIRNYWSISYEADFVIYDREGKIVEVIDTKSEHTRKDKVYRLKRRLFYDKYGIEIIEK